MDYDRCVAHHISGRYKGQRCKSKATLQLYEGSKLKTCRNHYNYYSTWSSSKWVQEIVTRGILGRYDHA